VAVFRRSRTEHTEHAPEVGEAPAVPGPPPIRAPKGNAVAHHGLPEFDTGDHSALEGQIEHWVGNRRKRLGDVLLERASIDPEELLDALQRQRDAPDDEKAKARLGDILLELGSINEETLAEALGEQFGVPVADLKHGRVDPEAVARVPEELARRHGVLPVKVEDDRVFLASAEPLDTAAIQELTVACRSIGLLIGARSDIERLIDQEYSALRSADDFVRAFELADNTNVRAAEAATGFQVDENAPVVQVVNRILTQGVRSGSSDVHIEPAVDAIRVRYRVDGAMTEAIRLPARMGPAITGRLKVMAELNIVERRRPQDGQFSVLVDDRPIDVRVSVVPTVSGEKTVLRLLDKRKSLISMRDLGMIAAVEDPYLRLVKAPLGMVLCTGPTGSGKTTTLYATLTEVNDPTKNVVTIEDPVEYQFEGVSQMQVSDSGMTFADGLRGILRQDPDVILVGEIRDEETARIAMQAALTGHLVLSSLHAIDSVAAVARFMDMGIEPFLVSSAINGVVAQRLIRRLCPACREPVQPSARDLDLVAEHTDGQMPLTWYRGRGCNLCNGTGFRGRVGVYELLEFDDVIRELVVRRASHAELRNAAVERGMRTMQEQAFMLVTDGVTTVDEVLRSVYAPSAEERVAEPRALGPGARALPPQAGAGDEPAGADPDGAEPAGAGVSWSSGATAGA
jgi:type IV pilus assembly protein PilB